MHATSAGRIVITLLAGVGAAVSFAESVTVVSRQWWADNGDEMNERFGAWLLR